MRFSFKRIVHITFMLVLLIRSEIIAVANEINNPLIDPQEITTYNDLSDDFLNILLLGIDFGTRGYWGSGSKMILETAIQMLYWLLPLT